ncbi:WD domain, G-beta repeat [Pirellula sp. SH-Sr6A]|uniref:c-type cytochrome domain-containing protein n=1 Tax=Pirellula sp. SH-Sr6A TaxID=1632865 RepID=UPI00078D9192|nr:c-type cytochrome domain-containing protein [Pirellula sp. SH-Sr6A]AMV31474.1 WD domain, G-beta repeat [Pirellula sp. SH-Sr6A]
MVTVLPKRLATRFSFATALTLAYFGASVGFCLESPAPSAAATIDYSRQVQPILTKYCSGCHNDDDAEADVQLHSLEALQSSDKAAGLIVPKNAADSKLWKLIEGSLEPVMPPVDETQPTDVEKQILRDWIDQGALGESKSLSLRERWNLPRSSSASNPPGLYAMAPASSDTWIMGYQDHVAIKKSQWMERQSLPITGRITKLRFAKDGKQVAIISGIPGLGGQITIAEFQNGSLTHRRTIEGHSDAIYGVAWSPDGQSLATSGYDKSVRLWSVATGELVRTFSGHNGAVYDVDFDPTGQVIATASADETIKLWRVDSGERLDTMGQGEAEQYAVRFSPSGDSVLAVGADRRIRVWKIQSLTTPTVSPMLHSVFAHEAAVVAVAFSPDGTRIATAGEDRSIKAWTWPTIEPLGEAGRITDVPTSLFWKDAKTFVASSIDGKVHQFVSPSTPSQPINPTTPLPPAASENHSVSNPSEGKTSKGNPSDGQTVLEFGEVTQTRSPATAQHLQPPCRVSGALSESDARSAAPGDWYSLDAKAGEPWLITIEAATQKSPMDSFVDILDASGKPVLRTRLQALRESYFTFRGKDSTIADDFRMHRWEDMELNEYLYAAGEVVRLWLYPRGPDSGFKVYPGERSRWTYFDTTATTHALNEPAWIVRELQANEAPTPNGLPVFPIYYSNDDESTRRLGKDSQLTFTPPEDGRYLIRVRDARGQFGDAYRYRLVITRPNPQFSLQLEPAEITMRSSGGAEFSLVANRREGHRERIDIRPVDLPVGLAMTSDLNVESDQIRCVATFTATPEAFSKLPDAFSIQLEATSHSANYPQPQSETLTLKVKKVAKETMPLKLVGKSDPDDAEPIREFTLQAGTTGVLKLVIDRGKLEGDISFGNAESGRNLPHGVFVDNIGLNGLLIPAGQSTREVFITAAKFVPEQVRHFHIKASVDGNPTTLPVAIRIVR